MNDEPEILPGFCETTILIVVVALVIANAIVWPQIFMEIIR